MLTVTFEVPGSVSEDLLNIFIQVQNIFFLIKYLHIFAPLQNVLKIDIFLEKWKKKKKLIFSAEPPMGEDI